MALNEGELATLIRGRSIAVPSKRSGLKVPLFLLSGETDAAIVEELAHRHLSPADFDTGVVVQGAST